VAQAGDEHPDRLTGAIIFTVQTEPHAMYERRGNNLYTTETISLLESLTGFTHKIAYLSPDQAVTLSRRGITPPGYIQEIPGYGLPVRRQPHPAAGASEADDDEHEEGLDDMGKADILERRGKLYVTYQVLYPEKHFTDEQRSQLAAILDTATPSSAASSNDKPKNHHVNDL
jgi:DnaJ-class molecular chaperone